LLRSARAACLTPEVFNDRLSTGLAVDSALAILDRESFEVAQELIHDEVSRNVNEAHRAASDLLVVRIREEQRFWT
jgi:hypothetical protein